MAEPSYAMISRALQDDIAGLDDGARIASEHSLQRRFGVSRATARAALDELESQLLIRRVRGLGTFVNRPIEYVIARDGAVSWWDAVRAAGRTPRRSIKDARWVAADGELAAVLDVPTGELVSSVTIAGFANDTLCAFGMSWVTVGAAPDLVRAIHGAESLEAVLANAWGLRPVAAAMRVTMETPPGRVRTALELSAGSMAWHVSRRDTDGRSGPVVSTSEWWYRADAVRVVAEL